MPQPALLSEQAHTVVTESHHAKIIISSPHRKKTPKLHLFDPSLIPDLPPGTTLRDRKNYSIMTTCTVSVCDYGRPGDSPSLHKAQSVIQAKA